MGKQNNLSDLSDVLYEQLYKLSDKDLTDEKLEQQLKRTEAIRGVADTIIKNGELQFKALKMAADVGIVNNKQVRYLLAPAHKDEDAKKIAERSEEDEDI